MENKEVLYRCDWGYKQFTPFETEIQYVECEVLRKTPKGCWVIGIDDKEHFVLGYARKKYAHPTKREALLSYYYCRVSELKRLSSRIEYQKELLKLAKDTLKQENISYSTTSELELLKTKFYKIN